MVLFYNLGEGNESRRCGSFLESSSLSIREKLVGKVDSMQGEALKDPDRMHQATCLMSQFIWQTLVQIIMKENL